MRGKLARLDKLSQPDTLYCACGNPAIRLPNGQWLRQDGARICERCRQVQHDMYHGWFKDEEILKRRERFSARTRLSLFGVHDAECDGAGGI